MTTVIATVHWPHVPPAAMLLAILLLAIAAPLGTAMVVGGMVETLVLMARTRFRRASGQRRI
jgi:hypothetical protein